MRFKITGRQVELRLLSKAYETQRSELVVMYGRRRVGKSSLIQAFIEQVQARYSKRPLCLSFEGLEKQKTPAQLEHFTNRLKSQIKDPLLQRAQFQECPEVF